ncbi:MAG: tetratricopeptide repeat protein [Deltaproteobacteria bacterium]|nr:tetratricopeptide repeat protein [Deltaproteobacteria bacterium]
MTKPYYTLNLALIIAFITLVHCIFLNAAKAEFQDVETLITRGETDLTSLGSLDPPTIKTKIKSAKSTNLLLVRANFSNVDTQSLNNEIEAVQQQERILGAEHPAVLRAKINIAMHYAFDDDYLTAKDIIDEILPIQIRTLGSDHIDTISTKKNLAVVSLNLGDYKKAQALFQEVLQFEESVMGPEDPNTLATKHFLANIYHALGLFREAIAIFLEVIEAQEKVLGLEHPHLLITKNNLVVSYIANGNFREAIALCLELMEIRERLLGPDHPDTLITKHNLASAYNELGNYNEALTLYKEILDAYGKILPLDHPSVLDTKHNLASTYLAIGNFSEAIAIFQEVLEARERVLGPNHPETIETKNNMALAYSKSGNYTEALAIYQEVLDAYEKVLGPEHPQTLLSKNNTAVVYLLNGNYSEALAIFLEVLKAEERVLGPEHPQTLLTMNNVAYTYIKLGNLPEGLAIYQEALEIKEKVLGPEHPSTALSAYNLGNTYYENGNLELAIFYVKRSIASSQLTRDSLKTTDDILQDSYLKMVEQRYYYLVKLLLEAGRPEEAQSVLSLLKIDELSDPDLDPSLDYTSAARDLLMENTPEGQAMIEYFETTDTLSALGRERRSLEEKKQNEELSPEETIRLAELDSEILVATQTFWDYCDALPQILAATGDEHKAQKVENLESLPETLRTLGDGAVLIHALAAEDTLYLFLTTPNVLLVKESAISRKDLEEKIKTFYYLLNNPSLDPRKMGKELYDLIIGPFAAELIGAKATTIMFYLDGPMRYIPMGALYDGEKFLIESYATALFIDTARDKLRQDPNLTPIALGFGVTKDYPNFPALLAVKDELNAIIQTDDSIEGVIPGTSFYDDNFTQEEFYENLRTGATIVHIASHFKFENTKDESFILLGDGTPLTVYAIKRGLSLGNLDLLTLSACDTATGIANGNGVEIESLGEATLKKGAMSVLATLWPVNDVSTANLMADFYSLRYNDSLDKAQALKIAQLNLMNNIALPPSVRPRGKPLAAYGSSESPAADPWNGTGFSHPSYWAPFVIMGNWR